MCSASNAGKLVGALSAPLLVGTIGLSATFVATGTAIAAVAAACAPGLVRLARATTARREQLRPIVEVLAELSLFDGATTTALERVAASLATETVPAGSVVMRKGDMPQDLYIIRSGEFEVTDSGRVINSMRADDWFGEIGLLQGRPRTATVTATTDAELWRIPGSTFLDALQAVATEPSALFDVISDRLARSADVARVRPASA